MAVLRVKTTYRAAAGRLRRRIVNLPGKWPNFLVNDPDKQVHLITGKAVYPSMVPARLNSIRDLAQFVFPPPPRIVEERLMNCEENSFWPITVYPYSSHIQRQQECYEFLQETLKASRAQVAAELTGESGEKTVFWGAVAVTGVGVLLIFGQFALQTFGSSFSNLKALYFG